MTDPYRDGHAPHPPTYRPYTPGEQKIIDDVKLQSFIGQTQSLTGSVKYSSATDELELLREWARHGSGDDKWVPGLTISESILKYIASLEAQLKEAKRDLDWSNTQNNVTNDLASTLKAERDELIAQLSAAKLEASFWHTQTIYMNEQNELLDNKLQSLRGDEDSE
jgi:hypothetical protein